MASVEKYTEPKVLNQIKHIERQFASNSNKDIVAELTEKNYALTPDRGMSTKQYYLKRKSELYAYGRDNLVTGFGWVITAPAELPTNKQELFFRSCYEFVAERYGGEQNVIAAQVHYDEGVRDENGNLIAGQPHMHMLTIPVVPDNNPNHWQDEKICCKQVINKKDLQTFHDDFQAFIDSVPGLDVKVKTGRTAAQGGNITVEQYKKISKETLERQNQITREMGADRWHGGSSSDNIERSWR